jgi:arsenite methyltransferase
MSDETPVDERREQVRTRYAAAATAVGAGAGPACCAPDDVADAGEGFGADLYDEVDHTQLPEAARLASLGCGNPTAVAELREGETVLDLGSGAGLDVILSARRVGPDGLVYGLDYLDEMLQAARRNIIDAEIDNIVLLKGVIEAIPLPADTLDVIISNCVINLSADKPAVFREMHRTLVPGGRIGVTDVVAEDRLNAADRAARGTVAECMAGALSVTEYRDLLTAAGLRDVEVVFTQEAADGLHSAIIQARKPV